MNKKNLIADFYMYEFIYQYGKTDDEDFEYNLQTDVESFLKNLKIEFLDIVGYAIAHELSHIWWETQAETSNNSFQLPAIGGARQYVEKHIDDECAVVLQDFLDTYKGSLPELENNRVLEGVERSWAYRRILNSEHDITKFINSIKKLFTCLEWRHEYGGKKWENISNAFIKLYNANTISELFIACDHVLDLQHNTATIFNKIPTYKENDSYDWINEFLTWKSNIRNPWEIYEHCIISKQFAARKLKMLNFGTYEEFKGEPPIPELVTEDPDIMIASINTDVKFDLTPIRNEIDELLITYNNQINKALENNKNNTNKFIIKHTNELKKLFNKTNKEIINVKTDTQNKLVEYNNFIQKELDIHNVNSHNQIADSTGLLLDKLDKLSNDIDKLNNQVSKLTKNVNDQESDIKSLLIKSNLIIDNINEDKIKTKNILLEQDKTIAYIIEKVDFIALSWFGKIINRCRNLFRKKNG